jgi:hypothetical protein
MLSLEAGNISSCSLMCDVDGLDAPLFGGHEKESATFICAVHKLVNLRMCVLLAKCHPKSTKLIDADPGGTLSHLNVLELHPHSSCMALFVITGVTFHFSV